MCIDNISTDTLQQLSKLRVLPTRGSELPNSLSFLEKIHHIEINGVSKRDGVVFYHLDVFLQHQTSHIPTMKATTVSDQPDYQLQRRFSDFVNLRYEVWMYAQRAHEDGQSCTYCGAFMSFIVHSMSQPRALVKLTTGVNIRKKLLTTFCNAFIEKTIHKRHGLCVGSQSIPRTVELFFRSE